MGAGRKRASLDIPQIFVITNDVLALKATLPLKMNNFEI